MARYSFSEIALEDNETPKLEKDGILEKDDVPVDTASHRVAKPDVTPTKPIVQRTQPINYVPKDTGGNGGTRTDKKEETVIPPHQQKERDSLEVKTKSTTTKTKKKPKKKADDVFVRAIPRELYEYILESTGMTGSTQTVVTAYLLGATGFQPEDTALYLEALNTLQRSKSVHNLQPLYERISELEMLVGELQQESRITNLLLQRFVTWYMGISEPPANIEGMRFDTTVDQLDALLRDASILR